MAFPQNTLYLLIVAFMCSYRYTHSKLRVAFNNVCHRILKMPPRSSASTMY